MIKIQRFLSSRPNKRRRSAGLVVVLVSLFALIISGCDSTEHKIGSTIKGERVAVLDRTHKLEADPDLKAHKPTLPQIAIVKDWPQAGYGADHVLPNAAVDTHPKEIWRVSLGKGTNSDVKLLSKPIVAGETVFTMDSIGLVSAFDKNTGKRKWEFDTTPSTSDDSAMGGGIGYDAGVIFATTGFGEVIALNAEDGKVKWRHSLQNPIRSAPSIAYGHVYALTIDNELQALDESNGALLWHHHGIIESATLMGASNPAVTDKGVVVTYSSGEIFDLRAENGRASWSYALTVPTQVGGLPAIADIRGLPVVKDGRVYTISHSGRIAAIDERTGDRAWETDIGGINTPIVTQDTIFILSNDMQLVALDRESGRLVWVQELQKLTDPTDTDSDPLFWTGPILASDTLWLVDSTGKITAFSPIDGKLLYNIDLDDPIYITPIISNNIMYVVLDSGTLVALK